MLAQVNLFSKRLASPHDQEAHDTLGLKEKGFFIIMDFLSAAKRGMTSDGSVAKSPNERDSRQADEQPPVTASSLKAKLGQIIEALNATDVEYEGKRYTYKQLAQNLVDWSKEEPDKITELELFRFDFESFDVLKECLMRCTSLKRLDTLYVQVAGEYITKAQRADIYISLAEVAAPLEAISVDGFYPLLF